MLAVLLGMDVLCHSQSTRQENISMGFEVSIGFPYELGFSCVAGSVPALHTLDSILSTGFQSYIRVGFVDN